MHRFRSWIDQGVKWPPDLVLHGPVEAESTTQLAAFPPAAARKIDFVRDIQPIFATRCYECHSEKKQEAQFRLDSKEIALKGGELGPAIVPGNSQESLLIRAVAGVKPDFVMKDGIITAKFTKALKSKPAKPIKAAPLSSKI